MKQLSVTVILIFGIGLFSGCQSSRVMSSGEWIDLSHDFSEDTIYWPTADSFHWEVVSAEVTEKGCFYAANNFCAAEHGGTHLDAPVHFPQGKWTIGEIPLDRLIGPGILIDVTERALQNHDCQVRVEDMIHWEATVWENS